MLSLHNGGERLSGHHGYYKMTFIVLKGRVQVWNIEIYFTGPDQ